MAHDHAGHDHTVRVLHVTAPTCWWSWGFYGTLNRVKAVYGDQVRVETFVGCVWDDLDAYLKGYELDAPGLRAWAEEATEAMGVPIAKDYALDRLPRDMMPATYATLAAFRQGEAKGERFLRATLRRWVLALEDVTRPEVQEAAAKEAGLDVARFRKDLADTEGLDADAARRSEGWPHVSLGFYNLAVTDGHRHVLLDHAFEPDDVVSAIEWLSGGALAKREPKDVAAYLRAEGPAPLAEIRRVFALEDKAAEAELVRLEGAGKVRRVTLAGAPHWEAVA